MKTRRSTRTTPLLSIPGWWITMAALILVTLTSSFALAGTPATGRASQSSAESEDGGVLPPNAKPNGYSLSAVAKATAFFNTSSPRANPPDLPCLLEDAEECAPIQILFSATGGDNSFSVSRGTIFYVPVILNDDSPPIIGSCPITATTCADFPNVGNRGAFLNYMYSPKEFGLRYSQIVVDGKVHNLGSDYLVEVRAPVPPGLADGSGTQYMTSAAFLAPLSAGIHTVQIRGNANGDDLVEVFTALGLGIPFPFSITYTVTVY